MGAKGIHAVLHSAGMSLGSGNTRNALPIKPGFFIGRTTVDLVDIAARAAVYALVYAARAPFWGSTKEGCVSCPSTKE